MSRLEGQTQEGPFLGGGVDEGVPLLAQSKTSDLSAAVYKCLHNTTTAPEKYRTNVLTRRPQNTQNVVEMILEGQAGTERATKRPP